MQILNYVVPADKWIWRVYIIERLHRGSGRAFIKAWQSSHQHGFYPDRNVRPGSIAMPRKKKKDGLNLSCADLKWEKNKIRLSFFRLAKKSVGKFLKLRIVSFQFISKGASLVRNKDALTARANTEWADSRGGKWAVIMSISHSVSCNFPCICLFLFISQVLSSPQSLPVSYFFIIL